jgi:hypothetical protein
MADVEAEVWAEELLKLVEEEQERSDNKLTELADQLKGAEDPFPASMGPRFPTELLKNLPPQ